MFMQMRVLGFVLVCLYFLFGSASVDAQTVTVETMAVYKTFTLYRLVIDGTSNSDYIEVGANAAGDAVVYINGATYDTGTPAWDFFELRILAGDGDDTIVLANLDAQNDFLQLDESLIFGDGGNDIAVGAIGVFDCFLGGGQSGDYAGWNIDSFGS